MACFTWLKTRQINRLFKRKKKKNDLNVIFVLKTESQKIELILTIKTFNAITKLHEFWLMVHRNPRKIPPKYYGSHFPICIFLFINLHNSQLKNRLKILSRRCRLMFHSPWNGSESERNKGDFYFHQMLSWGFFVKC